MCGFQKEKERGSEFSSPIGCDVKPESKKHKKLNIRQKGKVRIRNLRKNNR